ncbi:MAG TPA: glycoside hydrolase 43 family protein [Bacteroidales bacterium]|nr:glycoside hydrolase 43 family protein [Bacteroidales bacterium]
MRNFRIFFVFIGCLLLSQPLFPQFSGKWGDQSDGTYVNPVIPGDFSDIDAIRVGNDFYAISSTMQFSPGMVVLHSKDLVNWEIIGHVADDLTRISPSMNWDRMNCYGKGIWAGSIRYYKKKFWVYFGTPDDGFFMSSASHAAGPWEPLHQLWRVKNWDDCCSFCDDDGQLYFVATNFGLDVKNQRHYNIHLFKMTPDGKNLMMESDTIIYQAKGSEANKLYKINGLYYHFFSQVKDEGRVIMMQRSKSIYGPYEVKQLNHVNRLKDKEPNQGGLIGLTDGSWWFLTHHGSGDWDGRVASLLSVNWVSGWPIIGTVGKDTIGNMVWKSPKPIRFKRTTVKYSTDDSFSSEILRPQWEWNYQPRAEKWSLTKRKGYLRLYAFRPIRPEDRKNILLRAGNTLTQRSLRTLENTVTVKLDISGMVDGQTAGITHFSTASFNWLGIKQENSVRKLTYNQNNDETSGVVLSGNMIWIRSSWSVDGLNRYLYSLDGKRFFPFGGETQLTWGSYRGDRIGIFNFNTQADNGFVDVDFFQYHYSKE